MASCAVRALRGVSAPCCRGGRQPAYLEKGMNMQNKKVPYGAPGDKIPVNVKGPCGAPGDKIDVKVKGPYGAPGDKIDISSRRRSR